MSGSSGIKFLADMLGTEDEEITGGRLPSSRSNLLLSERGLNLDGKCVCNKSLKFLGLCAEWVSWNHFAAFSFFVDEAKKLVRMGRVFQQT